VLYYEHSEWSIRRVRAPGAWFNGRRWLARTWSSGGFWNEHTGWGSALLVWSIIVGTMDNVLRPFLIRKGADLPLLLIFAGVIGGLIAFGIIGLFVGPVVLAIAYTLLSQWMAERVQ